MDSKTVGGMIIAALITGVVGGTLTTVQGFASDADVAAVKATVVIVETESKERDAALAKRFDDHLERQRVEQIDQSKFRGRMEATMKILLERLPTP